MKKLTYGSHSIHNSEQSPENGMTKREFFAVSVLQGLVSISYTAYSSCVKDAVILADALIAELNKENGK